MSKNNYTPVPGVPDAVRNYMSANGLKGGKTVTEAKRKALAKVRRRKREIRLEKIRASRTSVAATVGTISAREQS